MIHPPLSFAYIAVGYADITLCFIAALMCTCLTDYSCAAVTVRRARFRYGIRLCQRTYTSMHLICYSGILVVIVYRKWYVYSVEFYLNVDLHLFDFLLRTLFLNLFTVGDAGIPSRQFISALICVCVLLSGFYPATVITVKCSILSFSVCYY